MLAQSQDERVVGVGRVDGLGLDSSERGRIAATLAPTPRSGSAALSMQSALIVAQPLADGAPEDEDEEEQDGAVPAFLVDEADAWMYREVQQASVSNVLAEEMCSVMQDQEHLCAASAGPGGASVKPCACAPLPPESAPEIVPSSSPLPPVPHRRSVDHPLTLPEQLSSALVTSACPHQKPEQRGYAWCRVGAGARAFRMHVQLHSG